jgi:hypothetical protein
MGKYRKYVTDYTWNSFQSLQDDQHNFNSFVDYFSALVSWLKQHSRYIDDDWLRDYKLDVMMNLNVSKYISICPEVLLANEPNRIFQYRAKTMGELLSRISHVLWDLVKMPSGKNCPRCKDGGLDYVVAEVLSSNKKKIILQCDNCTWEENLDGTKYSDGPANIYPANKDDLSILVAAEA